VGVWVAQAPAVASANDLIKIARRQALIFG
jgi:hypothetical protein